MRDMGEDGKAAGTLADKFAVVTGAGTGIGRAIAIRFAREGAKVAMLGRREDKLRETLKEMPGTGHEVCPCDIGDPDQVAATGKRLISLWRRVDILVSNAGISKVTDPLTSSFDDWNEPLKVNFYGAVSCCRIFAPAMPAGGRIIFVTSIHGTRVEKGGTAYAASKAAANQYARAMALEMADRGILVNVVAPGFVDTPMSQGADGKNELESDWFKREYIDGDHLPLRRAGKPSEIAGVVMFLAGPDSTYMTGEVVVVDGGLTIAF